MAGEECVTVKKEMSKLRKLRVLNNMTQEDLSERLNISQSYLSLLERDKREINEDLNKKLEDIFGISIKFL